MDQPDHGYSAEEKVLVEQELAGLGDDGDMPRRRYRRARDLAEEDHFGDMLDSTPKRGEDEIKVHGARTVSILRDMVDGLASGSGDLYRHTSRVKNPHDMVEMRYRAHVGHRASKHDARLIGVHRESEVKAVSSMSDEQFAAYMRRMTRLDTGEGIDDTDELRRKLEAEGLDESASDEESDEESAAEKRKAALGKRQRTAVAGARDERSVARMRGFVSSLLAGHQRAMEEASRRAVERRKRQKTTAQDNESEGEGE